MNELEPSEILKIWESHYGKLDNKWASEFFYHPAMNRLITFEFAEINNCLSQEKNLSKALENLIREYGRFQKDWDKWKDKDYESAQDSFPNSPRAKRKMKILILSIKLKSVLVQTENHLHH